MRRLVARGMTNRAVAAELLVSTKTVEVHLTRIYSKLGVSSRAQLIAAAADEAASRPAATSADAEALRRRQPRLPALGQLIRAE